MTQKLKDYYEGKSVFITGITGFKGAWLALLLNELGAKVFGLGLPNTEENSIYNQAKVYEFAEVFNADIRDVYNLLTPYSIASNCDYVFHLAEQPQIKEGFETPIYTFDVNLMGTLYLQETLRHSDKTINYLNATSDKVYKPTNNNINENMRLEGEDPYSLSKTFSDMVTKLYKKSYFGDNIKTKIARSCNVVGGGDWTKNKIIVDIIKSSQTKETLTLNNPNSIRSYQYVLDCLISYLYINAKANDFEYNVGLETEYKTTTEDFVKEFKEFLDFSYETSDNKEIYNTTLMKLDNSKFKKEFGLNYYANDLKKVAKLTTIWYNKLYNNEDMKEYSSKHCREVLRYYDAI